MYKEPKVSFHPPALVGGNTRKVTTFLCGSCVRGYFCVCLFQFRAGAGLFTHCKTQKLQCRPMDMAADHNQLPPLSFFFLCPACRTDVTILTVAAGGRGPGQ